MPKNTPSHELATISKVFETEWFWIEALTYKQDETASINKPYYRLSGQDSAVIIALTHDHKMILIRQFRRAIGSTTLEFPSGQIDLGEKPEFAIERELLEETAYKCDSIEYIGPYRVEPCRINSMVHVFLGKNAKLNSNIIKDKEIEEVLLLTENEFIQLIQSNSNIVIPAIGFYSLAKIKGLI